MIKITEKNDEVTYEEKWNAKACYEHALSVKVMFKLPAPWNEGEETISKDAKWS
jgi:hypothetical protein